MSQVMRYEVRLFGPLKGATRSINGHKFVGGVCYLIGKPEAVSFALKYLESYQAFARGTPQFDRAIEREAREEKHGVSHNETGARDRKAGEADDEIQPVRPGAAERESGHGGESGEASTGSTGSVPDGDGHEDAGIPKFEESKNRVEPSEPAGDVNNDVRAAVMKLDPDTADHWTRDGKPKLSAVEGALGRAGVTRRDVDAAAPDWTRDRAVERVLKDM